jgi:hypothetical protein
MKEILFGWCDEGQRIEVCYEEELIEKFMEEHPEKISKSGYKQDTTIVKVSSV